MSDFIYMMPSNIYTPLNAIVTLSFLSPLGGIREFAQRYDSLVLDTTQRNIQVNSERIGHELSEQASKLNIETTFELLSVPLTRVLPFLYLGNSKDAQDEKALDDKEIKQVLNLTCSCENHFIGRKDIIYKQVKIEDSCKEDIMSVLLDSVLFIGMCCNCVSV